jgi:hypothetical protein
MFLSLTAREQVLQRKKQLLNAGVKVSGDRHEYLIPFNQLLSVQCKRGLVWGGKSAAISLISALHCCQRLLR